MIIGFTGSQKGMSERQKQTLELFLGMAGDYHHFHHGDCVGADAEASAFATIEGHRTIAHPPINECKRAFTKNNHEREPKPYLERNKDIVNESQILIAAPTSLVEKTRSGTWATIRHARKKGIPVIILDR